MVSVSRGCNVAVALVSEAYRQHSHRAWQTFPHTATAQPLPHGTAQPPPVRDRDNHVLTNSHSHVTILTAWEPIT